MKRSGRTSEDWLAQFDPEARTIFADAVVALGKAAQEWNSVASGGFASKSGALEAAVEVEVQLRALLSTDVARLLQLTRRLIDILDREIPDDVGEKDALQAEHPPGG